MIVVELTALEAQAYEKTKNVEEWQIENSLFLDFYVMSNGDATLAHQKAAPLVTAAKSARAKIAEATKFEIKVIEDSPKTPTQKAPALTSQKRRRK